MFVEDIDGDSDANCLVHGSGIYGGIMGWVYLIDSYVVVTKNVLLIQFEKFDLHPEGKEVRGTELDAGGDWR